MATIASNFRFLGTCLFAQLAAVFFPLWKNTKTRLMGALFYFVCHDESPFY